ncbi:MAG: imidazolonepropionase-like amidohydrolase [Planctomycetota bacterium]|jgi:imidazolonepropionase-like amidohydrolase
MLTPLLALAVAACASPAESPAAVGSSAAAKAFVGARLLPISGPAIDDAVLVVRDGKIEAIGARGSVTIPADADRINASGRTIMPGLICTHSHAGSPSGGDRSHPIQPETRTLDAIDVTRSSIHRSRAGGLTTLNVMPGSGHLISGQTTYLKLRLGQTVEELVYHFPDGSPMGGLKMANGTNPQDDSPFPGTRAKSAALVRARYIQAQEYQKKIERAAEDPEKDAPPRDLALEALVEAMQGKRIVHHHTHRHDDIVTVLRLAEEFGFRVVLHHVSEGWRVADQIAAAGVPCSAIVVDSPGGKQEATRMRFDTCKILDDAGVRVALHTDDYITDSRLFLRSAALAVRAGLSRERALEAMTIAGAEMLDLADRVGTLEVGKDADLCVLDGDPLSVYTHVVETWVEGERVFDLSNPEDRIYSVGGAGAGDDVPFTDCCANVR